MKKSDEELERKLILLYKGDWQLLQEILAGRLTPTEFIRRAVRKTIERAHEKRRAVARNIPDVEI